MLLSSFVARAVVPATLVLFSATASLSAHALTVVQNFNPGGTGANGLPADWTPMNNSVPLGSNTVGWASGGAPTAFRAQDGSAGDYAYANFNAGGDVATISDWFYTPTLALDSTSVLSFYTRAAGEYADGLEVRWSSAGTPSVGSTATSVGTFTTLLLAINPRLTTTGYPLSWTEYTVDFSSLSTLTSGNIAFRYFVTEGGLNGSNSNFIGIDTITVTNVSAVPEPASLALFALALGVVVLGRRHATRD